MPNGDWNNENLGRLYCWLPGAVQISPSVFLNGSAFWIEGASLEMWEGNSFVASSAFGFCTKTNANWKDEFYVFPYSTATVIHSEWIVYIEMKENVKIRIISGSLFICFSAQFQWSIQANARLLHISCSSAVSWPHHLYRGSIQQSLAECTDSNIKHSYFNFQLLILLDSLETC